MKTCPYCAEEIQDAAIVCKHCGRDLQPQPSTRPSGETRRQTLQAGIPSALQQLGKDWVVETQTDTAVVFKRPGKAPNHVLHFILSLLTMGLWLIVWFFVALGGKAADERQTLLVDDAGQLAWAKTS